MSFENKDFGNEGELLAENFLLEQGFEILEKKFTYSKYGEIDIIAQKGDLVTFIEVKRRSNFCYGGPLYSINEAKKKHLYKTASSYFQKNHTKLSKKSYFRFDLIAIQNDSVEWIKDIIR